MWATRFDIASNSDRKVIWLDYLFAVNLLAFYEHVGSMIVKDLKPDYRERALNGQIPLCWDELSNAWLAGRPYQVTGNRMLYRNGPMQLVDYLFDHNDTQVRGGWRNDVFRLIYRQTLSLIEEVDSKPKAEEWGRRFKKLIIFTCWLLPYACKDTLFDRTKPKEGKPSERMWFSSYQAERPEELMGLYNSRANSDQGEDFPVLFRLIHIHCYWQTGRKSKVLYGRPLKSKMVQEIQGLSPHGREQYFKGLMT